jgi:hypothetical protein
MLQRQASLAARCRAAASIGHRYAAVMVLLLGLAACGQKGPLTQAKPASAAAPASSPAAR